jgi:HD-GYP domain-containing protein (c-di-GMP phosphodiesterase class II)
MMKREEDGRERFILISEKIKDKVVLPRVEVYPLFVAQDILEKTLSLIQAKDRGNLSLLYFLSSEEVGIVDSFLKSFNVQDVAYGIVGVFSRWQQDEFPFQPDSLLTVRTSTVTDQEFGFLVEKSFSSISGFVLQKRQQQYRFTTLLDIQRDLEELINIGKALSLEKDSEKLLRSILYLSKKITGADAGSIFLVEEADGKTLLRFKYSHTFSKDLAYEEFTLPLDVRSIAGYVAVTGKVLNIPEVYSIPAGAPYSFNRSFDQEHGYRTKSMLTVPMRNHIDEIIGVIQLINSKESVEKDRVFSGNEAFEVRLQSMRDFEEKVIPFEMRYESLLEAVASQAAIAIENNRLIKQIEKQFDEFVIASVTAIESRDPATSGHSERVARMSVRMAKAVNSKTNGAFKDLFFSENELKELEMAGLLHDFGKVYIDPNIFLKGNKLFSKDLLYLLMRLNFLYRSVELHYSSRERDTYAENGGQARSKIEQFEREKSRLLANLLQIIELIEILNQPLLQRGDPEDLLQDIERLGSDLKFQDLQGEFIPLLTDYERENFSIKRGSLNAAERKIIESHVGHSYAFVSKIPWPPEYRRIPEIILKHHEKLDGSGYPQGLKGKDRIPIQARMLTIADIFDALSAPDRPYKKSVPMDRVLAILKEEANFNKLDGDLVDLLITERLYKGR